MKAEESVTQENTCCICDKPCAPRKYLNQYNLVCDEHWAYNNWFQVDKIRVSLGRKELKSYRCYVCSVPLTENDKQVIQKNDYHIVCSRHRDAAKKIA